MCNIYACLRLCKNLLNFIFQYPTLYFYVHVYIKCRTLGRENTSKTTWLCVSICKNQPYTYTWNVHIHMCMSVYVYIK